MAFNHTSELWADPKTGTPLAVEMTFNLCCGPPLTMVINDFAFDAKLDEALSSAEPPVVYAVSLCGGRSQRFTIRALSHQLVRCPLFVQRGP